VEFAALPYPFLTVRILAPVRHSGRLERSSVPCSDTLGERASSSNGKYRISLGL
jgi:hypothetical protein